MCLTITEISLIAHINSYLPDIVKNGGYKNLKSGSLQKTVLLMKRKFLLFLVSPYLLFSATLCILFRPMNRRNDLSSVLAVICILVIHCIMQTSLLKILVF